MKNIFKLLALVLFVGTLAGCDAEPIVFDAENGQTALSLGATSYNLSIPVEGLVLEIPVQSTTRSDAARTFSVTVADGTTAGAGEYTLGSVTIPAGEHLGVLTVTFDYDAITGNDGDTKDLILTVDTPAGGSVYNETASITFFREIICNDHVVTLNTDFWGSETGWNIVDSSGSTVIEFPEGSYPNGAATYTYDVFLADGCYTLTITDQFGDGQVDGTGVDGSIAVTCSILQLVNGGGAIGSSASYDFCVNP